tara:strand:+ start:2067 stop:2207 length:141 start_codon:yes stop_codon:yes gene_type:complete
VDLVLWQIVWVFLKQQDPFVLVYSWGMLAELPDTVFALLQSPVFLP